MTLRDAVGDDDTGPLLAAARWETRAREAESQVKSLARELDRANEVAGLLTSIDSYTIQPPTWTKRKTAKGDHIGTPCLLLSDTHFDEVVDPAEVQGANAYDRTIAEQRLHRTLTNVEQVAHGHLKGVTYDGAVLLLGGDMFTGDIHEELTETNADTMMGSLVHWLEQLTPFVAGYRDMFGKVHVWGVVGNHGRTSRKPRAKRRVKTNFDWLLYVLLAREFADDDRVTFTIPESADVTLEVHATRFLLTHGDQARGGSGISGPLTPWSLLRHRKGRREDALGRGFDHLVMGHWHTYLAGMGLIVNGSTKGYDEYAYLNNFAPEIPTQAFWIVTPEHGVRFNAPIFPGDRKREGW